MCWLFGTFLLQNQLRPLRDWRFLFSPQLSKGKVFVHYFKLQAMLSYDLFNMTHIMRPAKKKFVYYPDIDQKFCKAERARSQVYFSEKRKLQNFRCFSFAWSGFRRRPFPFWATGQTPIKDQRRVENRKSRQDQVVVHHSYFIALYCFTKASDYDIIAARR